MEMSLFLLAMCCCSSGHGPLVFPRPALCFRSLILKWLHLNQIHNFLSSSCRSEWLALTGEFHDCYFDFPDLIAAKLVKLQGEAIIL